MYRGLQSAVLLTQFWFWIESAKQHQTVEPKGSHSGVNNGICVQTNRLQVPGPQEKMDVTSNCYFSFSGYETKETLTSGLQETSSDAHTVHCGFPPHIPLAGNAHEPQAVRRTEPSGARSHPDMLLHQFISHFTSYFVM